MRRVFFHWRERHSDGKASLLTYLPDLWEYMVIGHCWSEDSWIKYHQHKKKETNSDCIFNQKGRISFLQRISTDNSGERSFPLPNVSPRADLILYASIDSTAITDRDCSADLEVWVNERKLGSFSDVFCRDYLELVIASEYLTEDQNRVSFTLDKTNPLWIKSMILLELSRHF